MKNKILLFSVIIIFGIIFFILYKGLEDSNIYTPDLNTKKEIPAFNTKEFFSGKNVIPKIIITEKGNILFFMIFFVKS